MVFIILMQAEQVDKDLTTYAIKENFNPDLISEDKKAAWAVYNDAFDPKRRVVEYNRRSL